MAQLIWTDPALIDLDRIAEYIAIQNPHAAQSLIQNILDKTELLSKQPHSGKPIPEISETLYREWIIPPCRIFYKTDTKRLYILHIIRAEKEYNPHDLSQY